MREVNEARTRAERDSNAPESDEVAKTKRSRDVLRLRPEVDLDGDVDLLEEHGDSSAVDRLEAHQVRLGLGLFDGPVQQAGGKNKKRAGE